MSQEQLVFEDFEVIEYLSEDEEQEDKQQGKNRALAPTNEKSEGNKNAHPSNNPHQEQKKILLTNLVTLRDEDDTEVLHKNIPNIYIIQFSQTGRTVGIGTEDGLRMQSTESGPQAKKYVVERESNPFGSGIKLISLLYDTFICALVTDNLHKSYPNSKVYIWDQINAQIIEEYNFYQPITQIAYMREFLLVGSTNRIVLYDIVNRKPLKYILDVAQHSIFTSSLKYDSFSYAYLADNKGMIICANVWFSGCVQIDFQQELTLLNGNSGGLEGRNVDIIKMVMSPDGRYLAACEQGGHVVKVFETEKGKLRCTLYRGQRPKIITDMQFNKDSTVFGLISTYKDKTLDEGTIHIYDLSVLSIRAPYEKLRDIMSIHFNFDILKKQSYADEGSLFSGPLIHFDPKGAHIFTIYSASDYTISQQFDLKSDEPKKRLNDNKKIDGWIDPIHDSI